VTLEFLGPFFVAFFGTRTRWEAVFPLAARSPGLIRRLIEDRAVN